jgi:hypothetical protein
MILALVDPKYFGVTGTGRIIDISCPLGIPAISGPGLGRFACERRRIHDRDTKGTKAKQRRKKWGSMRTQGHDFLFLFFFVSFVSLW